uniref:Dol-P-Glc:Glc(2)Man(9)GlcNAc(2)-PP-Dol alpha-1,2-glucosyltransferase n=1 Tax=Pavo cristatus TaxID=9049 RepID=A0A8C9FD17_PAVCR
MPQEFEKDLRSWDPMITTPPGLYLLSVGVVKPAAWLFGWTGSVVCSTGMLRFINLLISAGNFYLLYLLLLKIHQKNKVQSRIVLCTSTNSFLTVFDPAPLLHYSCVGHCEWQPSWKTELLKKKDERISSMRTSFSDLTLIMRFLIEYLTSPKNLVTLIALTWPYIVLVTAFFVFVFINGGIVVGDRSSHEACLHFPQLFYFLSFTLFFSFPHLLTPTKIRKFLQSLRRHRVQYILIAAISLFLIWKFTYVHKYLLADNRHYTFYVWRKIFQRHELVKYVLVPAYIFAGWSFVDTIKSKSIFWILMYFVCLLSVTVPQKLLEFRYFILPFLIYRLNIPFPPVYRQLVELAFYVVVNVVTFYVFLNKTFQWPNSVEIQRFMW